MHSARSKLTAAQAAGLVALAMLLIFSAALFVAIPGDEKAHHQAPPQVECSPKDDNAALRWDSPEVATTRYVILEETTVYAAPDGNAPARFVLEAGTVGHTLAETTYYLPGKGRSYVGYTTISSTPNKGRVGSLASIWPSR